METVTAFKDLNGVLHLNRCDCEKEDLRFQLRIEFEKPKTHSNALLTTSEAIDIVVSNEVQAILRSKYDRTTKAYTCVSNDSYVPGSEFQQFFNVVLPDRINRYIMR